MLSSVICFRICCHNILERKDSWLLCSNFVSPRYKLETFWKTWYQQNRFFFFSDYKTEKCSEKKRFNVLESLGLSPSWEKRHKRENHSRNLKFWELQMSILDYAFAMPFYLKLIIWTVRLKSLFLNFNDFYAKRCITC